MSTESGAAAPAQTKRGFYYGWIILAICAFSETVSLGVGGSSFSVFLRPMSDDLGWSRTQFTGAVTLQALTTLMVAPVVGILLDKYGPRFIMVWGALVASGGYLLLGSTPWEPLHKERSSSDVGLSKLA